MTLSVKEILAAKASGYYNRYRFSDGRGNFCPSCEIAKLRGAKFNDLGPIKNADLLIVNKAMQDLSDFLGFSNVAGYLEALEKEGFRIFERVNNGNV